MNKTEKNFAKGFFMTQQEHMNALAGIGPDFEGNALMLTEKTPSSGLMKELKGLGFKLVDKDGTGQCLFLMQISSDSNLCERRISELAFMFLAYKATY